MPKYTVNFFTIVDVRVRDVEADSPREALLKAEGQVDFNKTLRRADVLMKDGSRQLSDVFGTDEVWWTDGHQSAVVDDNSKTGEDGTLFDQPEDGWREVKLP